MAFLRSMTVLQVRDVTASIAFYKTLGFNGWGWPDTETGELVFAIIQRGDVTIGLQLLRGEPRVNTHWAAYIYVDDVAGFRIAGQGSSPRSTKSNRNGPRSGFESSSVGPARGPAGFLPDPRGGRYHSPR